MSHSTANAARQHASSSLDQLCQAAESRRHRYLSRQLRRQLRTDVQSREIPHRVTRQDPNIELYHLVCTADHSTSEHHARRSQSNENHHTEMETAARRIPEPWPRTQQTLSETEQWRLLNDVRVHNAMPSRALFISLRINHCQSKEEQHTLRHHLFPIQNDTHSLSIFVR